MPSEQMTSNPPPPARPDATSRSVSGSARAALTTLRSIHRPTATELRAALGKRTVRRFGALILLVVALGGAMLTMGPDRAELTRAIDGSGVLAPVVAVLASALLAAAIIPRTLLALVGGLLFGWLDGAAYMLVGVTLGATLAFTVGRLLGREFVAERLRGRMALIERAVARRGAVAVMIARMIPLVPFGISNYGFGTTSIRPGRFVLGTLLGTAPATLAYAALGSATAHGNPMAITVAGIIVSALSVGGGVGTYLVWRRRPRSAAALPAAAG